MLLFCNIHAGSFVICHQERFMKGNKRQNMFLLSVLKYSLLFQGIKIFRISRRHITAYPCHPIQQDAKCQSSTTLAIYFNYAV